MNTVNIDINKRYTFADYLTWMDDKRRELFNGFVKLMTPTPARIHQRISISLAGQFWRFLQKQKCEVYTAPFDVRFPSKSGETADNKIYTVVQPDICIICDETKLDEYSGKSVPAIQLESVPVIPEESVPPKKN